MIILVSRVGAVAGAGVCDCVIVVVDFCGIHFILLLHVKRTCTSCFFLAFASIRKGTIVVKGAAIIHVHEEAISDWGKMEEEIATHKHRAVFRRKRKFKSSSESRARVFVVCALCVLRKGIDLNR